MAGLAAASSLSEAGFEVVLLEAADYLGKDFLAVILHFHCWSILSSKLQLNLSNTDTEGTGQSVCI